jgi:hypothetical protein
MPRMKVFLWKRCLVPLMLGVGMAGCGPVEKEAAHPPLKVAPAATNTGSALTAPVDYVAGTIRAGAMARERVDLIVLQKAIEAFQQEEGRNPGSLDELFQKSFVKVMPAPPPGQKFDYDAATGRVQLAPRP